MFSIQVDMQQKSFSQVMIKFLINQSLAALNKHIKLDSMPFIFAQEFNYN